MADFTNYLIPQISWSQNDEYIILNIELVKTSDNIHDIKDNAIFLTCKSNNKLYKVDFELYDTIKPEESSYFVQERCVKFLLRKGNDSEKWIRITKDKNTYKSNIKVNWSEFDESDGEEEDNMGQNMMFPPGMDFSSMMGGNNMMFPPGMMPDGLGEVDEENEFDGNCGEDDIEEDTLDKPLDSIDLSKINMDNMIDNGGVN
jgi:hypothetical protein